MRFWSTSSAGLVLAAVMIAITAALVFATANDWIELYIPGAAHVAGSNNTTWRTDLELRSVSSTPAQVRIDLLRRNRDNTTHPSVIVDVAAGAAHRFEDVLDLLFGVEGSATLRLTTLSGEIRATSRTYNATPEGTYGQFIGATIPGDIFDWGTDATLIQLSSSPTGSTGFRTNIGLVNLEPIVATIHVDLYRDDRTHLGRVSTTLEPYEFDQIDNIFARVTSDEVADGFAIIRTERIDSTYLTYASVIDNLTGDPIFIPGLPDQGQDPQATPTTTPTVEATPTVTPTPSIPIDPVVVTTIDEETYNLVPTSIRFIVGNGIQTSLILCSFDGTLSQVASSSFSFIRGPTETVEWGNCCSGSNTGARLEYETFIGLGGPAVARNSCTAGTPVFAISGTEVDTGLVVEIDGEDLDLAVWP